MLASPQGFAREKFHPSTDAHHGHYDLAPSPQKEECAAGDARTNGEA